MREAVGTKADLLFGTHGQFTASGAIRLAKRLEPYDPLWFEEPMPPEKPEEMAKVARATSIPIATGERLTTKYEFARVLAIRRRLDPADGLGRVGGILEAKKIAAMAETYYAQIAPHLYCGPVVGAANIQLAASLPNFLILESIERWGGFHAAILKKPIGWEDGYVDPADGARPRRRARRGGGAAPSLSGKAGCISKWPTSRSIDGLSMRYAFIGLGHLGRHLAASLLRGGFAVTVHDLDRRAADRARRGRRAMGGRARPKRLARRRRVITCLPSPAASRSRARRGACPPCLAAATWIEMSTMTAATRSAGCAGSPRRGVDDPRMPGHRRRAQGGGGRDHRPGRRRRGAFERASACAIGDGRRGIPLWRRSSRPR